MDFKKVNMIQVISIIIIVFLIGNMIYFAFAKGNSWYFWIFIGLAAIYAFFIMPMFMKAGEIKAGKHNEKKEEPKESDSKPNISEKSTEKKK